jgi:hypothetical protein
MSSLGESSAANLFETSAPSYSDEALIALGYGAYRGLDQGRRESIDTDAWTLLEYSFEPVYGEPTAAELARIAGRLSTAPLVDLGGGRGLSPEVCASLGITDYTVVDPQQPFLPRNPTARYVAADALEYLLSLPGHSANVMSNGFLTTDIFGGLRAIAQKDQGSAIDPKQRAYVSRVLSQVRRVLPEAGVFVGIKFDLDPLAEANDLRLNPELSAYPTVERHGEHLARQAYPYIKGFEPANG